VLPPCDPLATPFSNLKNYLYPILLQYGAGRPALVFCASRREAEDSAAKARMRMRKLRCTFSRSAFLLTHFFSFLLSQVVEGIPRGAGHQGGPAHPFVRSAAAASALASAASAAESPRLASCLPAGVAFHSAALSSSDRSLVESLFREGALLVLCTTSTLAQGVNLPARLVVVKGTRQYDKGGYKEYPRAAVLQMIGRAGRPQFDERGLGVVMTERHRVSVYTALAGGGEAVESRLAGALAEHVAAEVVAGTVSDISQAVTWLQASFLAARMRSAPAAYGLPHGAQAGAMEREMKALLLRTCAALADAGCIKARRHRCVCTDVATTHTRPLC
jgi:ATP-dependent DNA helicase HFM1/MER3